MLNQTRQKFEKFRHLLQRKQKEVEEEIKRVETDDPVYADSLAESSEPGTDSWIADIHTRALALKDSLQTMLKRTRLALVNLKTGKYGKCERCGKDIEIERLEAIPTATLCISCSKKPAKKR